MRYANWVKKAQEPDEEDYFVFADAGAKKRLSLMNLLAGVAVLLLQFAGGLFYHGSSRVAWIFFPYVLNFVPPVFFLFGAVDFVRFPARLSKKQWERSLARCSHGLTMLTVVCALNAVLELVYVFRHAGSGLDAGEWVYLALTVILLAVSIGYGWLFDKNISKRPE